MMRTLWVFIASLLVVSPALAQTNAPQAQLRLTVVDQTKAAVAGASVTVTRPEGSEVTIATDERGQATVQALPIAPVQVRVEVAGFEPFEAQLTLRRGTNDLTVTLVIAGFKEEIVVADTTATDDRRGNALTTTLEEKDIAELPDDPVGLA